MHSPDLLSEMRISYKIDWIHLLSLPLSSLNKSANEQWNDKKPSKYKAGRAEPELRIFLNAIPDTESLNEVSENYFLS